MKMLQINLQPTMILSFLFSVMMLSSTAVGSDTNSFEAYQHSFSRVRNAYEENQESVLAALQAKSLSAENLRIYFRGLKKEKILQLWAWNDSFPAKLYREYPICEISGKLGPKRRQGDLQVPEGFYHIQVFNPQSNYHLSLGINYPNPSDLVHSGAQKAGGDIYIHGQCSSSGCLAMGNEAINEIYVIAVMAKASGQDSIPVHLFPFRMSNTNLSLFKMAAGSNTKLASFWDSLFPAYLYFEENKKVPAVEIDSEGNYLLPQNQP